MIHVLRGDSPSGFDSVAVQLRTEFAAAHVAEPTLTAPKQWVRVRNRGDLDPHVVHLAHVFHMKCAFCESIIAPAAFAHVEHFYPKGDARYVDRMFDWSNWLLVCPVCNTYKGSQLQFCGSIPCLIDPASEEPEQHLDFTNAAILFKTERGEKTVKKLKLQRTVLEDARGQWLMHINTLLLIVQHIPAAKSAARSLLIWTMQDDAPYAAMARSYLRKVVPKLAAPGTPHPRITLNNPRQQIADLISDNQSALDQLS